MKAHTLKPLIRSPTPISLRSDSVQPEERDEAKNLGGMATAPHLEPRVPSLPSPSPPAPSLKTRSKTISAAAPGAVRPLSTSAISPLSSSPSTPRASTSPRTSGQWDAAPKGGSLGRSHGATLGSRRPASTIFDEKEKDKEREKEREERERKEAESEGTGKTRSNSPPPPRQRYTPPPTILAPLVSAALGTPPTPVLAPPAPVLTPPLPSSPLNNNRQRAQTTGSKLATSAHKWLKVLRGNSQTNLTAASSPTSASRDGKNSPNLADDDIQELLANTIDRLKIET